MDLDSKGLIGTIAFHILVLALFIIFGFRTELPLPGEAGILVNFGDIDLAAGKEEPRYNEEIMETPQKEQVEETVEEITEDEPLLTQDEEEAPAMQAIKKPDKKPVEKKPEVEKPKSEPVKEQPKVEEKPKVNTQALYGGRKENTQYTGSQGNATGAGNMGTPTGSEKATDYGLGGGSGNQPGFYLHGRNAISLPTPVSDSQKEGKVIVQIKVDRSGKVVEAIPGVKGSTTLDSYLLKVAKRAALSSKFDSNSDARVYQTGTITYIFRVK